MACACNTNKKGVAATYVVTLPSGKTATYRSEIEAKAAVQRAGGGTVRAQ